MPHTTELVRGVACRDGLWRRYFGRADRWVGPGAARRETASRGGGRTVQPRQLAIERARGADVCEQPSVWMSRPAGREYVACRPAFGDLTAIHHDRPFGERAQQVEVVTDDHQHQASLRFPVAYEVGQTSLRRRVDRRKRFVGDESGGAQQVGHRQKDALAHARAEFTRVVPCDVGIQADSCECGGREIGLIPLLGGAANDAAQLPTDRAMRVQAGPRLLKQHERGTKKGDATLFWHRRAARKKSRVPFLHDARAGRQQKAECQAERRFAGTRLARDAQPHAGCEPKVQIGHDRPVARNRLVEQLDRDPFDAKCLFVGHARPY